MNLALDTNRYIDFCRGEPLTVSSLEQASSIHLPFVVLGELRAGVLQHNLVLCARDAHFDHLAQLARV